MKTKVSRPTPITFPEFDREPYIFEKKRIDDFGEEKVEAFYSVAGRKQEFQYLYPDGYYITEILELRPNFVIFKCSVYLHRDEEKPFRVAHATRELDPSTEFGRRFIECAETSAIGRALASAGIGSDFLLDELEGMEQAVITESPIVQKPEKENRDEEKSFERGSAQEAKEENQKTDEKPDDQSNKVMSHEQALMVVIETTASKQLKGKTFGQALTLMKDADKFKNFLNTLVADGTSEEKMAAQLILKNFVADTKTE